MKRLTPAGLRELINDERAALPATLELAVKRGLFKAAFDATMLSPNTGLERAVQRYAEGLSPARRRALKALLLVTHQHAFHEAAMTDALQHEAAGIRLLTEERDALEAEALRLNAERVSCWHAVFNRR